MIILWKLLEYQSLDNVEGGICFIYTEHIWNIVLYIPVYTVQLPQNCDIYMFYSTCINFLQVKKDIYQVF